MRNDNQGINPLPDNQGITPTYTPKPQANTLDEIKDVIRYRVTAEHDKYAHEDETIEAGFSTKEYWIESIVEKLSDTIAVDIIEALITEARIDELEKLEKKKKNYVKTIQSLCSATVYEQAIPLLDIENRLKTLKETK